MSTDRKYLEQQLAAYGDERRRLRGESERLNARIGKISRQALNAGIPLSHVAKRVGVTRQTIYMLLARDGT